MSQSPKREDETDSDDPREEVSPSGNPVYRHARAADESKTWDAPSFAHHEEAICKHIARYYGAPAHVFHELVSELAHIDVHLVPPNPSRHSWLLFTTGMSARPMTVPTGLEPEAFAELMLQLPSSWSFEGLHAPDPANSDERWYWPIRWLKTLARLPHEYRTWLGPCHTIPNGDPALPFHSSTQLSGWMLLPPVGGDEVGQVDVGGDSPIRLLHLHALHRSEMDLKLVRGADVLIDKLNQRRISEVIDPRRLPVG